MCFVAPLIQAKVFFYRLLFLQKFAGIYYYDHIKAVSKDFMSDLVDTRPEWFNQVSKQHHIFNS